MIDVKNQKRILGTISHFLIACLFVINAYSQPSDIEGRTLTLKECISIGLKANPSAEISFQNLKAVQEKIGEAKQGYYPSFKFSSSYTYTTESGSGASSLPDNYDARLSAKQTLFDAGATSNLIESIRHSIEAQEYDVKKTELDIIQKIKTAFYNVLKKRDITGVTKTALKSTEKHLEQAHALYKEGLTPRSDVIKAEVQLSNARLDVIKAENALLLAKANLAAAMGLPLTTNFDIDAHAVNGQALDLPALKDSIILAYSKRPELKGAQSKVDSTEATIKQVKSGLYPNISLDASYGWQESNFFPDDKKWSAVLTVSIPVFEQLTTKSKINQAVANLNRLKATKAQIMRNIELDVTQAWLSLKEAVERLDVTKKALEYSEEDMRVSDGRYKEGIGNILEVTDAQTALTQAKTNYVITIYDISDAKARLDRAIGKGIPEVE